MTTGESKQESKEKITTELKQLVNRLRKTYEHLSPEDRKVMIMLEIQSRCLSQEVVERLVRDYG